MSPVDAGETESFREVLVARLGLDLSKTDPSALARLLHERMLARGERGAEYLESLRRGAISPAERSALSSGLVVAETHFFRYLAQFRAFAEAVVPARMAVLRSGVPLRFLSAGCASGEEAWSLAMAARPVASAHGRTVEVVGVDVNRAALERARANRYAPWSMRETPDDMRHAFVQRGREFGVADAYRALVTFHEGSLLEDDPRLFAAGAYDAIFCRNVLMYFEAESARRVVARLARALEPEGFLFLGHAENLRSWSDAFDLVNTHGTFYYRLRARSASDGERAPYEPPVVATPPQRNDPPRPPPDAAPWFRAIGEAAERVAALAKDSPESPDSTASPPERISLRRLDELIRSELHDEALRRLGATPGVDEDEGLAVARAALLTQVGRLDEARRALQGVLLRHPSAAAEAHHLLALCHHGLGDGEASRSHCEAAIEADPAFGLPHLHLGLLERRSGRLERARREITEAIRLLPRERPRRVLLFGGGFGRDALLTLCRAELAACSGAP